MRAGSLLDESRSDPTLISRISLSLPPSLAEETTLHIGEPEYRSQQILENILDLR